MADKFQDEAKKKELVTQYRKKQTALEERLFRSHGKERYEFIANYGIDVNNKVYIDLLAAMKNPSTLPSEYVSKKMGWLFEEVITQEGKDAILYFADRLQEYPYSDSYRRRSFRAKENGAYGAKLARLIFDMGIIRGKTVVEPLEMILNQQLPPETQAYLDQYRWQGCGYTGWQVAYALDHHDPAVEEAVRRILTEENGTGSMTTPLICGILYSHRTEFHRLLGELLVAARLQEGLRQAICENADGGTVEAFLTILKVIAEHQLIRFSAVKRAVGTWLGILTDDARSLERVGEKSIRLIMDCIENKSFRESCLASEDAMEIYVALWSYALEDTDEAIRKILWMSEHGSTHQLLVCGYFAANLELPGVAHRLAQLVLKRHSQKEELVAVWLDCLMPNRGAILWNTTLKGKPLSYEIWFDSMEEVQEMYHLLSSLYHGFSGKGKTFSPCVFPWYEAKLEKSKFAEMLCALAALWGDTAVVDEACPLIKECSIAQRRCCLGILLRKPKTEIQRRTVLEGLVDKETETRSAAFSIASKLTLSREEYRSLEEYLRFKGADIRKNVMELLMKQNGVDLTACIARMLEHDREEVRLGALDMLLQLRKDDKRSHLAASFAERLSQRAAAENLPAKEKILLSTLLPKEKTLSDAPLFSPEDVYTPTEFDEAYIEICINTFAEYFPDSKLAEQLCGKKTSLRLLDRLKKVVKEGAPCDSCATAEKDLMSLSRFIDSHKTVSFVDSSGEEILLGNVQHCFQFVDRERKTPLKELWQEWRETNGITDACLLRAAVLFVASGGIRLISAGSNGFAKDVFGDGFDKGKEYPYSEVMYCVLNRLVEELPLQDRRRLASALVAWFVRCVDDDKILTRESFRYSFYEYVSFLSCSQLSMILDWFACRNDQALKSVFPLGVACMEKLSLAYQKVSQSSHTHMRQAMPDFVSEMGAGAYLYAAYQGILTETQLFAALLSPRQLQDSLEVVTAVTAAYYEKGKQISSHSLYAGYRNAGLVKEFLDGKQAPDDEDLKLLDFVAGVYEKIIPVILASELSRGDTPAAYSKGIHGIARIYGAEYLVAILTALGNDTLDRTAYYGWGGANDRKGNLSYLLSVCIPGEEDSLQTLRAALAGTKITPKRLVEAALFSPEWIPIVGEYLGIPAFESACYYFMAHMNERFDDKRKAVIARYTPLSEEELNLGAFDVNWFRSAYSAMGETEFRLLYDAAKYISDGAKHSRARKYADATLGKLDREETEQTVSQKRNKDLLMAYSLIPLTGEDDICHRYLYLQAFRKESKQFGSQRSASEGKAVEMALTNLAINAGYTDTMRLTLRMETKVIDDSRDLLEEQTVEGVSFRIALDENGKATLTCTKDGKLLKSVPSKLKKQEAVIARNEFVKKLNEQYRRTRLMLERAMEDGILFTFGELKALSAHPVVYPMLKNLVLVSGDRAGFLSSQGLEDPNGSLQALEDGAEIKIAHPFCLYSMGCWRAYQQHLYQNRIRQPFRQVFRELYIKTEEELEMLHSLRYAGNQIQPAKTVGALKSRRWVADLEMGLQKIYYKENVVAQICALADWFSPGDIEAPTLEWVCFTDRKTGESIKIADVPDIIFSEVMRDVDLAVSVAHAGGVDPETSHSTMEMRASILSFVLPMFRIGNVRIEGNHALVDGKLAEYSIHLGSGVVHQLGGAMIPVLPVHSQHKGKIFLPFVDDDPKTAEVISKVLLFAEDGKIKDPSILSCISK